MVTPISHVIFPFTEADLSPQKQNSTAAKGALHSLAALPKTKLVQPKGYGMAVTDGILTGLKSTRDMLIHPIDTMVKPLARFARDTALVDAAMQQTMLEGLHPHLKDRFDPHIKREAKDCVAKRCDDLMQVQRAFEEGSGPERVEMGVAIATSLVTSRYAAASITKVVSIATHIPCATIADKAVTCATAAARKVGYGQSVSKSIRAVREGTAFFARSLKDEVSFHQMAALSRGEETVIHLSPKRGCDATHYICPEYTDVLKLSEGKKLVAARVSSVEEINTILMRESQTRKISLVWITAHGHPEGICLDPKLTISGTTLAEGWPKDAFTRNAKVVLAACGTAQTPASGGLSIAQQIEAQLKHRVTVIAPTHDIRGITVSEGVFRFTSDSTADIKPHLSLTPSPFYRGDVHWVDFPEPMGRRPAVIISEDASNTNPLYTSVIVVPVTSNPKLGRHDLAAAIGGNAGKISTKMITTVPKSLVLKKLETLDGEMLAKLNAIIKQVLDVT